jgi:Uma2 family endonuclease
MEATDMALQPAYHEAEGIPMSEAEYLLTEPDSEVKREYIDGRVYAMAGASRIHNLISANVMRKFGNHLADTPCATFMADMSVHSGQTYVYPDVVVDCTDTDEDFVTAPLIVVEVLSKSSRKRDTTQKLMRYINMPSLQEYALVEQDIVQIQVLRRSNGWIPSYYYLGDAITFESIGLTLAVEAVYERVNNTDMAEFRAATLSGLL